MIKTINEKIHEYFLESERDGLNSNKTRSRGEYPNALLITKEQYKETLKQMFKLQDDVADEVLLEIKVMSIEGLKVIITDYLEEPKVIRLTETKNPS
jgi:hypothetical protein